MQSTQLACPYCQSTLTFDQDIAPGAAVPCLICGKMFIAADPAPVPPTAAGSSLARSPGAPRPPVAAAMPSANARALLAGGLVFAGLAVLVIGAMSLVLWFAFGRSTPAAEIAVTPVAAAPPAVVAPAPVIEQPPQSAPVAAATQKPKATVGQDVDLADVRKPDTPRSSELLPGHGNPAPEPPAALAPPTVPVQVVVGGAATIEQQRINAAIDKGVRYLKAQQDLNRAIWPGGPDVGYTALAGLTLLECQVPPSDPSIVKAAAYIRTNVDNLNHPWETYQLSLAILFLDRLGNPKDDAVIQRMALRLLSGQDGAGGWTYRSRYPLSPSEMKPLLVFLKSHRPPTPLAKAIVPAGELAKQTTTPVMLPKQVQDPMPGEPALKQVGGIAADPKDAKVTKAIEGNVPGPEPEKKSEAKKPAPPKKAAPMPASKLPRGLQQLPVVKLNVQKGKVNLDLPRGEDNSNTQFALMALWAARRHDVPTEYSLQLAQQRFIQSQNPFDHGWGYHVNHRTTNTMTCVGLIGLAMGHGVSADIGKNKVKKLRDDAIQKGLGALGRYIGWPSNDPRQPQPNLYFLWSLERVAMLYDLKTIGGKDWYAWGAQALVANQQDSGCWTGGGYHGASDHCDTCFALLFLKRSNLVPDLTENLRLYMVIRDPEAATRSPGVSEPR